MATANAISLAPGLACMGLAALFYLLRSMSRRFRVNRGSIVFENSELKIELELKTHAKGAGSATDTAPQAAAGGGRPGRGRYRPEIHR